MLDAGSKWKSVTVSAIFVFFPICVLTCEYNDLAASLLVRIYIFKYYVKINFEGHKIEVMVTLAKREIEQPKLKNYWSDLYVNW